MKLKIFIILNILSIHGLIQGQNNLQLNLEQCIEIAIKNNYSHKQAILLKEKAYELVDEAYGSALYPKIDGTIQYTRALELPVVVIENFGSIRMGSENTMNLSIRAEQPIFTGAMFLAIRVAETYAEMSDKAANFSEAKLISNVKTAYYSYLFAKDLVELSEMQLNRAEENRRNAKSMYDAGLASEYDYIRADVQYQNFLPALTESKNTLKLAKNNLTILLGYDLRIEIEISDSLTYKEIPLPDFETGLTEVMGKNTLLKQMELDVKLKDLAASYEYTKHFPELVAFANWQTQSTENDPRDFFDWRYNTSSSIGLTLRVPIFKGFTINSKVEQAEIDLKRSEANFNQTKLEMQNNYESIVLQIQKIEEQISAFIAAMEQTQKGYNIASKRFVTGLGTQLEVTTALLEYSSARINYLKAVLDYHTYHAQLQFLLDNRSY
ncbi:MAG: TolC family protein [Ignavibacteriales bacterium]|nr:TolC family protein [Ignavibacteriales bacterium]